MNGMEKLREIVTLAHEGMEGCDQPQFGIFNEIIEIANTPTTENKGGGKCLDHSHGEGCVISERNGGWDVAMRCLATPCIKEDGKYHAPTRPASPTKADKVEPPLILVNKLEYDYQAVILPDGAKIFKGESMEDVVKQARAFLTALDDVTGKGGM